MDDAGSETGEAVLSAAAGLQKLSPSERVPAICDAVIDIAAALFNVSGRELRHPGRSSLSVSRVRQIAMYVTHVALGLSMREVGQGFGRDRTTVLHACHQIEDMRDDQEFDGIVAMTERVMTAALGRAGQ
ncbi:MAG: chromosomal replication initiator DnaA [Aquamicrobium sp.]|nr:chromosomal replication initiator DnaA [Aquamicrobium sp.]